MVWSDDYNNKAISYTYVPIILVFEIGKFEVQRVYAKV